MWINKYRHVAQNGEASAGKSKRRVLQRSRKSKEVQPSIPMLYSRVPLAIQEDSSCGSHASELKNTDDVKDDEEDNQTKAEVKKHVSHCVEVIMSPLISYMRLLGLSHQTGNISWRKPLLIYNVFVLVVLNCYTVKKFSLISYNGMTVRFAFTSINTFFLASGGACASFLFFMQKNLSALSEDVISQLSLFDHNFRYAEQMRHVCKIMVATVFTCSCIIVAFDSMLHIEFDGEQYVATVFHGAYFFLDYYVVFITQSTVMCWAIFYALPCYILAVCLDKYIEDLYRYGVLLDGKQTNKDALKSMDLFRKRYQGLKKAADVIDYNFKYGTFYVQTICIIELCCLLYAYLQNTDGRQRNFYDTALFVTFLGDIMFNMLSFIVPAYYNFEKSKKIARSCVELFNNQLQKDMSSTLATKMALFMHDIEAPITFTSGGFFVVKRSFFLTVVSFTATYVLLMIQFTKRPECTS